MPHDVREACIFCRIVEGNLPATVVNRTVGFVAIEDINPQADVHLLVLPERHIDTFRDIAQFPADETKRMLDFVAETAAVAGLDEYRLLVFCGSNAGQTVFHLHWHILGGRMQGPLARAWGSGRSVDPRREDPAVDGEILAADPARGR